MDRYELITHNPPLSLRPWSTRIDLQAFWNLHHQPSNQESGNLPYQSSKTAWFCKLEREKKTKQNTRKPGKRQRPERGKFHPGWRRDMIISLEEDFVLVCNQINLSIDQSFHHFPFYFYFFCIVHRSSSGAKPVCFHSITECFHSSWYLYLLPVKMKPSLKPGVMWSSTSSCTWFCPKHLIRKFSPAPWVSFGPSWNNGCVPNARTISVNLNTKNKTLAHVKSHYIIEIFKYLTDILSVWYQVVCVTRKCVCVLSP